MTTTQETPPEAAAAADVIGGTEDPGRMGVADGLVALARAATQSQAAVKAGLGLSAEAVRIAVGRSTVEPAKGDNRFADPTWTENPGYRRLKQAYLAWSGAVDSVVEAADVDWRTRERARFAAGILTSSLAPTNTLPGNPAALKRVIETGGGSLLSGARHFVDDLLHNGGMPRQVDRSSFTVGENMAVTPGAVVYRDEVCEVLQYQPTTPTVRTRPVLMIPPPINKYYFMDLAPGRSFIEHAVSKGIPFFVISWRNPHKEHAEWGLDTYPEAVLGRLHGQFLDIFAGNLLVKPGGLQVLGTPVDLSAVKIDNYVTGGLSDHLTPWDGCYRATQLLPGHSTFVLSPTGHIQTQVSPPGNPKSHYFVGPEPGPDPHEWRAQAERRAGTWWDHWVEWVIARAGDEKPAPTKLGSRRHKVLGPAPGTYVLEPA